MRQWSIYEAVGACHRYDILLFAVDHVATDSIEFLVWLELVGEDKDM